MCIQGNGLTLMMEHCIMILIAEISVVLLSEIIKVSDSHLWLGVEHYVTQAHNKEEW